MKKEFILILSLLMMILIACDKDSSSPKESNAMIRLKSDEFNIIYLALSKSLDYRPLSFDEKRQYNKTDADWYINGGTAPFMTNYKDFFNSTGDYFYLLKLNEDLISSGEVTVLDGNQTWTVGDFYEIEVEQP